MTRREYIESALSLLGARYGRREAESIARLVAQTLCGVRRWDFALEPDAEISIERYHEIFARLAGGEPVQYVLGEAWFCDMRLEVAKGVLIPRPETEELVHWVLADNKGRNDLKLLDIGTGSGAIAIALARGMVGAKVVALDISLSALDMARRNAELNGAENVEFIASDILTGAVAGRFDIIISNPPYIPEKDRVSMNENVSYHEPPEALFVPDDDPLLFYRAIAMHACGQMLASGGGLYFEVHEEYADAVQQMLVGLGFVKVCLRRDIHDKKRMVGCRKA